MIRPSSLQSPSPVAPATGDKMRASKKVQAGCVFLTVNTYKRVPVFRKAALCEIFFREVDFYRTRYGFRLYGYALLPDHCHLLLDFPAQKNFSAFLRDFKSAVSRFVIDWAKDNNHVALLKRLRLSLSRKRKRDPSYCLLQANSYVRAVVSRSMFKQELEYIHANPVREGLVTKASDYLYSSVRNYECGSGVIAVDPHNLFLD